MKPTKINIAIDADLPGVGKLVDKIAKSDFPNLAKVVDVLDTEIVRAVHAPQRKPEEKGEDTPEQPATS